MKKKTATKKEHKFDLNIQSDKENTPLAIDENSLLALETKGQSSNAIVTPGKDLFKLNHSHKRKSEAWSIKSLPLNKTPKTPNARAKTESNTPCKKSTRKSPLKLIESNSSKLKSYNSKKPQVTESNTGITPRVTRRMARILKDAEEVESSEEDAIKEPASIRKKRVATRSKTPVVERCQKRIKANKELAKIEDSSSSSDFDSEEEVEMEVPSYESYFSELHGLSKKSTSNNNLSQLPVLDPQEYLKELNKICLKTNDLIIEQKMRLHKYFPDWVFELEYGFNILCYGYGSKKDLLGEFVDSNFSGYPILKVNGFFPTLNIRTILSPLLDLIKHTGKIGSVIDQTNLVTEYFNSPDREIKRLILLIHNIDSVSLRNEKSSTLLSLLAECPSIYVIASVDHINAACLWDHNKSKRFNWVWHDATTFAPWVSESTFENSVLVKTTCVGPRNVIQVLNSLNAHARGVILLFKFVDIWTISQESNC